ncbi:MAG: hypothetical protein R3F14_17020 [Polyangiaceae bacterium]
MSPRHNPYAEPPFTTPTYPWRHPLARDLFHALLDATKTQALLLRTLSDAAGIDAAAITWAGVPLRQTMWELLHIAASSRRLEAFLDVLAEPTLAATSTMSSAR